LALSGLVPPQDAHECYLRTLDAALTGAVTRRGDAKGTRGRNVPVLSPEAGEVLHGGCVCVVMMVWMWRCEDEGGVNGCELRNQVTGAKCGRDAQEQGLGSSHEPEVGAFQSEEGM
jgi:hypothetical protein